LSNHPRRKGELVQSASSEGWTIYEPETDSLHVLNASAKAIWELCDGGTSPGEMAAAISELTGLDVESARADVDAALIALGELGLLEPS
jgi:hypothetical protein